MTRSRSMSSIGRWVAAVSAFLVVFLVADYLLESRAAKAYHYDETGRLIKRVTPNGRSVHYQYDKAGLLTEVSYHRLGGIFNVPYPTGHSVQFEYDGAGNAISMKDALGRARCGYDMFNRPAEIIDADGNKLAYQYDPWDQLRSVTLPDGYTVKYGYDITGNVTSVDDGDHAVRYEYNPTDGRAYRHLPNGVTTVYETSPAGSLTSIRHLKQDGSVIIGLRYQYDQSDRVVAVEEDGPRGSSTTRYEYDLGGRLIKVQPGGGSGLAFEYDAMGNRTALTDQNGTLRYEYDRFGRLIKAGDTTFNYDASGNIVSKSRSAGTTHYEYDEEDRLVEVRTGGAVIKYAYDGAGNRVGRTAGGRLINYVNDTSAEVPQVVAESGADRKLSHYLLGATRIGRRSANGDETYLLEDRLGSTRCAVDARGEVVARYSYSPFGAPELTEGSPQTDFLFAGEQWDADAKLIYLRARYYDPEIGRFLSADPLPGSLVAPETFNEYAYAGNDPVNRVDPLGLQGWPPPPVVPNNDLWKYFPPPLPRFPAWPGAGRSPFPMPFPRLPNDRYGAGSTSRSAAGSPSTMVPWWDRPFNWFGKVSGSSWIGRNRSGGEGDLFSLDSRGQLPLGDTRVRGNFWADKLARKHDIEYWLSTHAARGTEVAVPGPDGMEYYMTGTYGGANTKVSRDVVLGSLPFGPVYLYLQDKFGVRRTPRTENYVTLDDLRKGNDDSTKNLFFPPGGGGGGGGGFPPVGGVYLDQTAKIIGELGTITGAVYDADTGEVILVGDKNIALPPMKPEYLGAAIRAVYSQSPEPPGMTIDPIPQNPRGPTMIVKFFGNTENTRLGWVMFEADRIMKGYSVGRDNITKQRVQSSVPDYQSVTAMGLADGLINPDIWSRFWLTPELVTCKVTEDSRAITFDPIKIEIKTQTMVWKGLELVDAKEGIKDAHAERFKTHFTNHYEEFASETAIYAELKQVAQAVALAKWMQGLGIHPNWQLVRALCRDPYPTPAVTPSAYDKQISAVRSTGVSAFGGVKMDPILGPRTATEAGQFQRTVMKAWADAHKNQFAPFGFEFQNKNYVAVTLPSIDQNEPDSYSAVETDLGGEEFDRELAQLPGLTRYYNSTHNEPTEFGFSWSLLMPRLVFEAAGEKGKQKTVWVDGAAGTEVLVQRFALTNQFGLGYQRFDEHFVDQQMLRIGFAPQPSSPKFRGIYPESNGSYRLILNSGVETIFDSQGKLRVVLAADSKAIYDYDNNGRLTLLRFSRGGSETQIGYDYDTKGRLVRRRAGASIATYEYDLDDNLSAVNLSGRKTTYRYGDRRLLTEVAIESGAATRNSYDSRGRLINNAGGSGERDGEVELTPEGRIVTVKDGADFVKRHYDKQHRLTAIEDSAGSSYKYSYDSSGRLSAIDATLPTGGLARLEISPDRSVITAGDPRGVRAEARFGEGGKVTEVRVNDQLAAAYRYDAHNNLVEATYGTGEAERFTYDEHERLSEYRRIPQGGETRTEQILRYSYDAQGNLVGINSDSIGQIQLSQQPQAFTAKRGEATLTYRYDGVGQPAAVESPDGSVVNYQYQSGGRLSAIETAKGGHRGRVDLTDDRPVTVLDLLGGKTTYTYNPAGALASVLGTLGETTSYVYDDQGRLREVRFPDGRWIEYRYVVSRSQSQVVTVISHAALEPSRQSEPTAPERAPEIPPIRLEDIPQSSPGLAKRV